MRNRGAFKVKVWYCGQPVIKWKDDDLDEIADKMKGLNKKFK